jgi:hypothetical protein
MKKKKVEAVLPEHYVKLSYHGMSCPAYEIRKVCNFSHGSFIVAQFMYADDAIEYGEELAEKLGVPFKGIK